MILQLPTEPANGTAEQKEEEDDRTDSDEVSFSAEINNVLQFLMVHLTTIECTCPENPLAWHQEREKIHAALGIEVTKDDEEEEEEEDEEKIEGELLLK